MSPRPPTDARSIADSARIDDIELWSLLLALDPEAIGLLFDRYSPAVYNFAFRRSASWSTAEEVVQATFATVWRRAAAHTLPRLERGSALPWLLGVASHESQNTTRSLRRLERCHVRAVAAPAVVDHADEVAARIDDERRMSVVRRALDRLPAHERITIELVVWSGLSVVEAADTLHIAEGTVKSRLARGRARLSVLLGATATDKEN